MTTPQIVPLALDDILSYVQNKVEELVASPAQDFRSVIKTNWRARTDVLRTPGVYAIFSRGRVIYVGMAGRGGHHLNYRLGDLFFCSHNEKERFHHYLTEKLMTKINRFKSIDGMRRFYLSCRFKAIGTETFQQARTLEAVLIELYRPRFND